jgi:hypothetical protein
MNNARLTTTGKQQAASGKRQAASGKHETDTAIHFYVVIPAEAGIQSHYSWQDSCFRGNDDWRSFFPG